MKTEKFHTRFDRIRSSRWFESFVVAVILMSALVIGVKTYQIEPWLVTLVYVTDWLITIFFLVEIGIRFLGEKDKIRFFHSGWNIFDTLIVTVSLIPIDDSELALLGRLIRIFRVLRMVSIIPELRILMNSLLRALPQLGYVCLLMFIIFYIYAALGTSFFEQINPKLWGDISISLLTLFRVMTFEDWTDIMYETMEVYPLSWIFYLTFIFLTAFAFLNMVIGIVVKVLEQEQDESKRREQTESHGRPEPDLYAIQDQIEEVKMLLQKKNNT